MPAARTLVPGLSLAGDFSIENAQQIGGALQGNRQRLGVARHDADLMLREIVDGARALPLQSGDVAVDAGGLHRADRRIDVAVVGRPVFEDDAAEPHRRFEFEAGAGTVLAPTIPPSSISSQLMIETCDDVQIAGDGLRRDGRRTRALSHVTAHADIADGALIDRNRQLQFLQALVEAQRDAAGIEGRKRHVAGGIRNFGNGLADRGFEHARAVCSRKPAV